MSTSVTYTLDRYKEYSSFMEVYRLCFKEAKLTLEEYSAIQECFLVELKEKNYMRGEQVHYFVTEMTVLLNNSRKLRSVRV